MYSRCKDKQKKWYTQVCVAQSCVTQTCVMLSNGKLFDCNKAGIPYFSYPSSASFLCQTDIGKIEQKDKKIVIMRR